MAVRKIITGKDNALRKKSREVTAFDARLHQLLDDLTDTMHRANGVGLAAAQVGVLRKAVVVDVGEGVIELVNPQIIEASKEILCESEGCLSFPGEAGMVKRPQWVIVRAQNRMGETITVKGEGLLARALCHETDHTNGIIFKDIADEVYQEEDEE